MEWRLNGGVNEMPVRKLSTRYTESDLQRVVALRDGGTPADVLEFIEATRLPGEAIGRPAQAIGSGAYEDVAGTQSGFVMLDYPVSVNRYWRTFKGRTVVSAEAVKYKRHVGASYAVYSGKYHHTEPVCVEFRLHPKLTKAGVASKTRMDLDNCIKVVLDALNNAAYQDDKQVIRLVAEIADPIEGGGLSVRVTA